MSDSELEKRVRRLEIGFEGQIDRIKRVEEKTMGASGVFTTSGASAMGGVPPVVSIPPASTSPEPSSPVPKKGGQSHYGGRADKDGNIILDNNGNVQIFKLNFADRAWGFFKSARARLRRWSKGNRRRENKFMYLDLTLLEIIDDLEEHNDTINTQLIIDAKDKLVDFLKDVGSRQHHEIDGTWKIVDFITGLFE